MRERADLDQKYVGTVFDRQVRIEDWNQDVLAKQTVLCVGAGGLGSVVIMNLLRLGVGRIIIVDYDKVDLHNLNRQLMYTIKDVGLSKVQACIKNAEFHNVGGTILQGFEGCAVTNWHRIVEFAKASDFIFNMIDYGDWFDAAIQALCIKLAKPFVMGGTFALSMIVDYLAPLGKPCYWCITEEVTYNKELSEKLHPDKILEYADLKFLPKNNNPVGRSSVCICTTCGEFMIAHYLNYLFFVKDYKTQRCIFYPTDFSTANYPLEAEKPCPLCGGKDPAEVKPNETKEATKEADEICVEAKFQVPAESSPKLEKSSTCAATEPAADEPVTSEPAVKDSSASKPVESEPEKPAETPTPATPDSPAKLAEPQEPAPSS